MSIFKPVKFYKEDVLPVGSQLMPNALYFIRVGEEFDLYVTTDTTPAVAKRIVPGSTPVESGHIILWNGVEVTPRSKLNFRGFTLTDREELDEIEVEFNPEETLEGSPEDTDTLAILTQDVSDDGDDDNSGEKGWLKITWANIKATLKTYFDTIYSTFSGSYNDLSHKPTIPSNAAQITVSDPVTPDFTPAVQGNNLQQITNKVAGLQNNLVQEVTFEEDITSFEITGLDLTDCEVIVTGITSSSFNSGSLTVNDINTETYWNSVNNSFYRQFLIYSGGIVDSNFAGRFSLRKVNNRLVYEHIFGSTVQTTGAARTIVQTGYVPLTGNINSIQIKGVFWKAGTTLKIYRL